MSTWMIVTARIHDRAAFLSGYAPAAARLVAEHDVFGDGQRRDQRHFLKVHRDARRTRRLGRAREQLGDLLGEGGGVGEGDSAHGHGGGTKESGFALHG